MPLLLCPNDNGAMQTVQRSGVEFDICPTCRGVWLDRGELEKLLDVARVDEGGGRAGNPGSYRRGNQDDRSPARAYERRDDDDDYRRKKRRSSIFDIFD
jgi:Zn-finger nucleic acid-binding protein